MIRELRRNQRRLEDEISDLRLNVRVLNNRVDDIEENGIDDVLDAIEDDGFLNIGNWQIGENGSADFYITADSAIGIGLYEFDVDDTEFFP